MEILVVIVIWLAFGVSCAMILSGKGRTGCGGFALGALLGPIGLIIAHLVPASAPHEAERQMEIDALKGGGASTSRLPNEQPQETPGESSSWPPGARPSAAPTPNVFLRERPQPVGATHYRWECDSCGEMGDWTINEDGAEHQAEAHVCARRIPRRR